MIGCLDDYSGELILGNIKTDDVLLMNVLYQRPIKDTDYEDYAYLVVKNVKDQSKRLITISKPDILIYIVRPQYRDYVHTPSYKPLSICEQRKVRYKNIENIVADVGGTELKEFVKKCKEYNRAAMKNVHKYPYVLGSDVNYPSYLRTEWALHYHNSEIETKITKQYLDIEVDGIDVPGFPTADLCPINAVSLIDEESETVYVFLLRNSKNPQIEEFEANINDFIDKCHQSFDASYGVLDYRIFMYDDELLMTHQVFALIHKLKRDFLEVWNADFDLPYFIDRIKALGEDPRNIMCDSDFKTPILEYRKDNTTYDFKMQNNSFTISSYTVFQDQMRNYIRIRKGKNELKSIKLNAIAKIEVNDEKLDYTDEADIKTLPYIDYVKFVLYNIKDTLLQMGIERKTHDLDNIFLMSLNNYTPYEKLFSQTVVLKNYAYVSYYRQGYILGNNRNIDYGKPRNVANSRKKKKAEFEGALVADPLLNSHVGMTIFGKPSKFVFKDVIDLDFSNMYPAILQSHNIDPETMIGKLILEGFEHLNTDPNDELYDQGKMFVESLLTKDYSYIGNTYFNLPTTEELIDKLSRRE